MPWASGRIVTRTFIVRHRLYIPRAVLADIAQQLTHAIDNTVAEFDSAWEDEDVVTGHLGGQLTVRNRSVQVTEDEINGTWRWSLHYRKFRGRGAGATEKVLGADGIFELTLDGINKTETKSILFQSKMKGSSSAGLVEQCARLSTWREAAFVILYGDDGFDATTIDATLQTRGAVETAPVQPLASFLTDEFLACHVGDNDLRYQSEKRQLSWRTINQETVAVRFPIAHRFRLKVTPPKRGHREPWIERHIAPSEVHRYRMEVGAEDLLKVQSRPEIVAPSAVIRSLSKIYHPDLFGQFSPETQELVKVRLQEFNEAHQQVRGQDPRRRHSHRAQPDTDDQTGTQPDAAFRGTGQSTDDDLN